MGLISNNTLLQITGPYHGQQRGHTPQPAKAPPFILPGLICFIVNYLIIRVLTCASDLMLVCDAQMFKELVAGRGEDLLDGE